MPGQLSPFYTELFQYLQSDMQKRIVEEGFDPTSDRTFRQLQSELIKTVQLGIEMPEKSLQEIIDEYNFLIGSRGAIHIEAKLLEALSAKDFVSLGLGAYFPKMYRGVPRLYAKKTPSLSRIKSSFYHLPSLKRASIERALYSLYQHCEPSSGCVVIFTWVILDGLGDWTASKQIIHLLKEALPQIEFQQIAFMPNRFMNQVKETDGVIFYENEASLSLLKPAHWEAFLKADVILQTPTFYPQTQELIDRIKKQNPRVKVEHVGEYGFVESSWFHPKTGRSCMGLHFLEKGVLTRKISSHGFASLKHPMLLSWLFGEIIPGPVEIQQYVASHHFYLAYLKTVMGGKIYLHALLKSLERDAKPIDICSPDLSWFVKYCQECKDKKEPCLQASFGVKQIEVWHPEGVYIEPVAETGKIVRLLYPTLIEESDFTALLMASEEFVAVRGDQSFSEVISANKIFFYDSSPHARYFLKDLAALAESRIHSHRNAILCIRIMVQALLAQLPEDEGEWIDEIFFQKEDPFDWFEASQKLGLALQDPDTLVGFKKMGRLITEELSCNSFFVHLIKRALCHVADPSLAYLEEKEVNLFTSHRQSFPELIRQMRTIV